MLEKVPSMNPIDWQELYAANRAVIEGRTAQGDTGPTPFGLPAGAATAIPLHGLVSGGGPTHLTPALRMPGAPATVPSPAPSPASGAGTWKRLADVAGAQGRGVFVYSPPDLDRERPAPVVVMLHGCTQTAAGFAEGTLMNAAADRHGFVVVYPEQSRPHNQQGCWNWFNSGQQARAGAEPAFIAAATRALLDEGSGWTVDERRVFVAGLSAGGAMAGVMAATHPDLFAAAGVHSGLAYGCAHGIPAALSAMTRGGPDPEQQGRAAHAAMGSAARVVPVISIHGTADTTVCPVNGEQVLRQWMATNRLAADGAYEPDPARPAATWREHADGGRAHTRRAWTDSAGDLVQEHIEVDGMGHAWSGGSAGGSYTDPRGPSAAEAMWSFFTRVTAQRAPESRPALCAGATVGD
jgi:poly(hydroxyalkanoate) depolymerase family esterase